MSPTPRQECPGMNIQHTAAKPSTINNYILFVRKLFDCDCSTLSTDLIIVDEGSIFGSFEVTDENDDVVLA